MRTSARLGQALAIASLLLLYPPLSAVFHGNPSLPTVIGIVGGMALLAGIYGWFWLRGFRSASPHLITIVVAALIALGLLINFASGLWTINPFIYPVAIAAYGYPVRLAVAAVLGLTLGSMAAVQPALLSFHLTPAEIAVIDVVGAVQLLIIGFGTFGVARLGATIAELHAAREQIAQLAIDQERARFARDLHDLMGHSLSVITLKGELAGQLIESAPGRAATEVQDIVQVAREALREVREAVSGYRRPTLANELAGARAALSAAGIECQVDQAAGALSPDTEAVLAWTVREGATNIIRHSQARRCSILMTRDDDYVRLDVVDDGAGGDTPQAGNGLRGLGERVREGGGRLEAGSLPHQGFRLRVAMPVGDAHPSTVGSVAEIGGA